VTFSEYAENVINIRINAPYHYFNNINGGFKFNDDSEGYIYNKVIYFIEKTTGKYKI
jgi:hypothetical protein